MTCRIGVSAWSIGYNEQGASNEQEEMDIGSAAMSNDRFRQLIEQGDADGVASALRADPGLANQTLRWYLNRHNEADPLHYVSDCVALKTRPCPSCLSSPAEYGVTMRPGALLDSLFRSRVVMPLDCEQIGHVR